MTVTASRRPASVEVCATDCGARCCRSPDGHVYLSEVERQRLDRLAGVRVVNFREVYERRDPRHRKGWALRFADHGGVCPFLSTISNTCDVYTHRPQACREFPRVPTVGCLIWPAEESREEVLP